MRSARPPIVRSDSTRAFVDSALSDLATNGYSPFAWLRFTWRSCRRSLEMVRRQPRAALEVHLLHLALLTGGSPRWVLTSWLLAWSHLGLLAEEPQPLGLANILTLLRANLPALARGRGAWLALPALLTDVTDGWIARGRARESAFGAYADALADLAFWTWYARRHEPSRLLRSVALSLWLGPAAILTIGYFGAARALDVPRPQVVRLTSAGFQVLLATRACARRWS